MRFKRFFFIAVMFTFCSQAFATPLQVLSGVVDVVGTQKLLKIFVSDDKFKQFMVLGNEKYEITSMTPDYVIGQIKKFSDQGQLIEIRFVSVHMSQDDLAKARERSAQTYSNRENEADEKPCSSSANAVINVTDNINDLRSYIDNGFCFKLDSLTEDLASSELIKTLNADGSINSQGAFLINGETLFQENDKIHGRLAFESPTLMNPRFYKGSAHFSGTVHIDGGALCPAGDYIVSGSGAWSPAQDPSEMGHFQSVSSASRGPTPLTLQIAGPIVKSQNGFGLKEDQVQVRCDIGSH